MTLTNDAITPSDEDAALAGESSRKLAPWAAGAGKSVRVQIASGTGGRKSHTVILPRGAVQLLVQLLTEMSKGNAVTLMPIHAVLTTQQAADILGVSRPFIIKEIKEKRIPCQLIGTHRRIAFKDLMAYKRGCLENHDKAMNQLVRQAQELNLGY